jgi:predicted metalloprotease with PDZ domain
MPTSRTANSPVHYRIEAPDPHTHLFHVTLTVAKPAAQQVLSLPVWIPGSYLVREFSKNLQNLQAHQGSKALALQQLDKHRWQAACQSGKPLVLHYAVYACDASVRTAWLDAARGFFNATSLCLRAEGHTDQPCTLEVIAPENIAYSVQWSCATGLFPLKVDAQGFGTYRADDYDTLADSPVEMGPFWSARFTACGVPHRIVVAGAAASFNGKRLVADTRTICETAIRFWNGEGKPPFKNYLFMLNVVDDGYGGLEHRNSTALICARRDLPRTTPPHAGEGYTTLLGLISHEYFHTWNVKRLRPAEFATYDYSAENYTSLLWFFEGFTSYYDDLLLRRAKRIDNATYLKLLTKTINQVNQTPGRLVQSVAQASFDAWVKYYRQDENTANATVSYYTKGSLVALCLDLTLRAEGHTTLDAVMRGLWVRCKAGPMAEADLLAVLQELGGRSFAKDIAHWVHSTKELPLVELLEKHGVQVHREPDQVAQQLGLRVKESGGLFVQQVLRGGAAEKAGFAAGDEWIAVSTASGLNQHPWRMQSLDDLTLYTGKVKKLNALIARDRRLMTLPLTLPAATQAVRLAAKDASAVNLWLDGSTSA